MFFYVFRTGVVFFSVFLTLLLLPRYPKTANVQGQTPFVDYITNTTDVILEAQYPPLLIIYNHNQQLFIQETRNTTKEKKK